MILKRQIISDQYSRIFCLFFHGFDFSEVSAKVLKNFYGRDKLPRRFKDENSTSPQSKFQCLQDNLKSSLAQQTEVIRIWRMITNDIETYLTEKILSKQQLIRC